MHEIAICDDDRTFLAAFQGLLADVMAGRGTEYRLTTFTDPGELLRAVTGGAGFSLIFLDIIFGVEKGVRLARQLRERDRDFDLVFVTSEPAYAVESFSAFPLSYLLKPVAPERLAGVIDRFLERHTPHVLRLSTSHGLMRIAVTDVLYFEIYSHTIILHLRGDDNRSWTGTFRELEGSLPKGCFVRPHRSYLVNLEHVVELERSWLRLSSGVTIPVSKNAYLKVQSSLIEYDDRRPATR